MIFSQRIGKKPVKTALQLEAMDDALRNSLWNALKVSYLDPAMHKWPSSSSDAFFRRIWIDFYILPLDTLGVYYDAYKFIKKQFFEYKWFEVYDFIEYISSIKCPSDTQQFRSACNYMLERELSGYRFINNKIAPITSDTELSEIEEAVNGSRGSKLSGVHLHLKSAIDLFSDRKKPDYRNSIKESISAVESLACIITGVSKAELGAALSKIDKKVPIHGALKKGFSNLYGYTSDEKGIRHCLLDKGSNVAFEDAKYMLVSCSAFINYLIAKASKARITFS